VGLCSSYSPISVEKSSIDENNQPDLTTNNAFVKVLELDIKPHTLYREIDFGFPYTSFIFEIDRTSDFVEAAFYSEQNESFKLDSIPKTDQPGDERRSPFIIPQIPQNAFTFYSGNLKGLVKIYFFYAPPIELKNDKHFKKVQSICDKPSVIAGEVWRKGLPDPIGNRVRHDVNHCLIHHAASSNSNTDYINVVRNIYLLHTQTNGWDDIGYNFVVAQDGSIFEGREHQNIDSTDNVKGAHFCGKNSNTMGICVLGNYQDKQPTPASIKSLEHLLTWKCDKDGINALGETAHPVSTSPKLAHIAGHQDGCATACPGDSLYQLLPTLRKTVDSLVKTCGSVSTIHTDNPYINTYWYQIPTSNTLQIRLSTRDKTTASLFSIDGRVVWKETTKNGNRNLVVEGISSGEYYLRLKSSGYIYHTLKVLIQ
jgi:hypothetical protein